MRETLAFSWKLLIKYNPGPIDVCVSTHERPISPYESRQRFFPFMSVAHQQGDHSVHIHDMGTGKLTQRMESLHRGWVMGVCTLKVHLPSLLIVTAGMDGSIRITDATTREEVRTLWEHDDEERPVQVMSVCSIDINGES